MPDGCTPTHVDPPSLGPRRRLWRNGWLLFVVGAVATGLVVAWCRPYGPDASYRRGRAALTNGDREAVLVESDRLVRTAGYAPHGWLLKGLLLTRLGKLDEAIVYLQKGAEDRSLVVEANTTAAQCYYQSSLYLQAIHAAQAALEQDETCLDARRWLASAYYDLGAVSHAVGELERISREAPTDPRPARLLGLIAKDGENFSRAIDFYRESLRRDPVQSDVENVLLELAECQIKLSHFDDALMTLKNCERSAMALTLEAECHSGLGRFNDAHDRLQQALTIDPRYFPAKLALGKLALDQGNTDLAVSLLTEAVRLDPHVSQGHFQLSQALRLAGMVDQADDELRQMQEIQALEREFSDLHDTAAKQPNDPKIRFRTGELALRLGKPKLAQIWFRAALAIDPNHAQARAAIRQPRDP